jgi:hypothetical protein
MWQCLPNHFQSRTLARTHTHTLPSILPLLEAPVEGFFSNPPEFSRRIRFNVLHGRETRPPKAYFQIREQPKVTRSEIRRVRCLGDDWNAFLGEVKRSPVTIRRHSIWSMVSCLRTDFALTHLVFKSSERIAWMDLWEMLTSCSNSTIVILR